MKIGVGWRSLRRKRGVQADVGRKGKGHATRGIARRRGAAEQKRQGAGDHGFVG
jgi:hypothetical protein